MSLKRSNSYSDITCNATLQCLASGINYPIGETEFVIGRSLVIEEKSIARRHCLINKSNGQYLISHNLINNICTTGTDNETYVNCVQIPNNQNEYQVLNHGDVISFADGSGNIRYLYRFVLQTCTNKKLKRNNEVYGEEYESSKSQSHVDNILKRERALMKRVLIAKLDKFNEIINKESKKVKKLKKTVLKLRESNVCPLCRTSVQTKTLCLSMDKNITNICILLGNAIKKHREKVQQEKLTVNVPRVPQLAWRGRRRRGIRRNI